MTEPFFLFETTAPYYAHFRPGYPDEFFKHVVQRFGLNGRGRKGGEEMAWRATAGR